MKIYHLYVLPLFFLLAAGRHPYHVSVCEIQHKAQSKSLQISMRIFTDDLEELFKNKQGKKLDMSLEANRKTIDSILTAYLGQRFKIRTDSKATSWKYLGYELIKDGTHIYLEAGRISKFTKITIDCTVLLDIFEDQVNLIHVKYKDQLKSMRFHASTQQGTLLFDSKK